MSDEHTLEFRYPSAAERMAIEREMRRRRAAYLAELLAVGTRRALTLVRGATAWASGRRDARPAEFRR